MYSWQHCGIGTLSYRQPRHLVIMDQWNGEQRAVTIKMFYMFGFFKSSFFWVTLYMQFVLYVTYFIYYLFSLALQPSAGYGLLWLCSPARAMASCGSAAQRGLWPPVAVQPSAGYGLLWLCSPARAMTSCGSAAQRGLWPPLALHPSAGYGFLWLFQPSAGYGLLWLCSPARAMAFCGSAAQRGLVHEALVIIYNNAPQSVGLLWTSDQIVAETST
jgi:hypothetical protein